MKNQINIPPDTAFRRFVTRLKNNRTALAISKRINPSRRLEIRHIEKALNLQNDDTVLDVGCGDGYWSNYFSRKCHFLAGIDPFEADLSKAKLHAYRNTEFQLATAEKLPFPDGRFMKVFGVCVFEHFYDDVAAFKEMNRILKPGGILAGTVDSLESEQISPAFREWHMKTAYCQQLYSVNSLKEKLECADFENINAYFISGSKLSVWWEMFTERSGIAKHALSLILYPIIMLLERKKYHSGYKILVRAEKRHA